MGRMKTFLVAADQFCAARKDTKLEITLPDGTTRTVNVTNTSGLDVRVDVKATRIKRTNDYQIEMVIKKAPDGQAETEGTAPDLDGLMASGE
jgi:hypothetical protein